MLTELAKKSDEIANVADQLATLAALDGQATLDDKVDLSNTRTRLKALLRESEDIHDRLKTHRDEHGC